MCCIRFSNSPEAQTVIRDLIGERDLFKHLTHILLTDTDASPKKTVDSSLTSR